MKQLKQNYEGFELYNAGLPNFKRNFTRDSIISAILFKNAQMLKNQLEFCALKQGVIKDPETGEEPGKIFHEYPGFKIRGYSSKFNACDTTALFIIGFYFYERLTGDKSFFKRNINSIEKAVGYIIAHLDKDYFFIDSPRFANADKFAIKATYWKDGWFVGRKNNEPIYPVVYTLAHIQNMRALEIASGILNDRNLKRVSKKMLRALKKLKNPKTGRFYIAKDKEGAIEGINSDMLHTLFYLKKGQVSKKELKRILKDSEILETSIGYRVLEPKLDSKKRGKQYSHQVVPFEQAIINIGAKKFGLKHVEEVSSRIRKVLDTTPEQFTIKENSFVKSGSDLQLWTIAAKEYFKRNK